MMIKHVGKHNGNKIVILYRQVPNESHMALIVYSGTLPRVIHDDLMKAVESASGQQSKEISDYLFRALGNDGNSILSTLHREGFIKKVPTSQVIVTPTHNSSVRLDELNDILNKMSQGEEAIKQMAELDKNQGMTGKKKVRESRDVGELRAPPASRTQQTTTTTGVSINEVLTDEQLASQRIAQAQKMAAEAKAMLAEAKRLEAEAKQLNPVKANGKTTKTKKAGQAKEA